MIGERKSTLDWLLPVILLIDFEYAKFNSEAFFIGKMTNIFSYRDLCDMPFSEYENVLKIAHQYNKEEGNVNGS